MTMGVLNEAAIERAVKAAHKDANGWAAALLEEQKRTNALLEQLVQVMQGQPRQFYPGPIVEGGR